MSSQREPLGQETSVPKRPTHGDAVAGQSIDFVPHGKEHKPTTCINNQRGKGRATDICRLLRAVQRGSKRSVFLPWLSAPPQALTQGGKASLFAIPNGYQSHASVGTADQPEFRPTMHFCHHAIRHSFGSSSLKPPRGKGGAYIKHFEHLWQDMKEKAGYYIPPPD
ncbi:hypothetical protein JOM56_004624 [Amanita muscaria]